MSLKKTVKKPMENFETAIFSSESLLSRAGFLLKKSALKMESIYEAGLKPLNMIGRHAGVLMVLEEKGSISQQEIGKCIYMDRTTMVDVIDDLEKLGLVERQEHPNDRRSHIILVTAKGKELLPRLRQIAAAVEKEFLSCISVKEQKDLIGILRKLVLSHYVAAKETR